MNITLRQLECFEAVAVFRSFTEAAQALHLSPAAVSMSIRQLEDTLGLQLFHRHTRQVTLTAEGAEYLRYTKHALHTLQRASLFVDDIKNHRTGVVRISMTQALCLVLMPKLFSLFQEQWPKIRIEVVDAPSDELRLPVIEGRADLAIDLARAHPPSLGAIDLFSSRIHLFCTDTHPLAAYDSLPWSALSGQPLIFIGTGNHLRYRLELPSSIDVVVQQEVNNTITALAMSAGGLGLTVCAGYVKSMLGNHNLISRLLTGPVVHRRFMLYHSTERPMSPAVKAYVDFLLENLPVLNTEGSEVFPPDYGV